MSHAIACPRLVVAGTGSGVGKTSLTLGLARLLARRGLRVQTFKVGPDFLDPTYLALASGRTCYNLDGWMTSRAYVAELFQRATADADLALIEGVMGMFDGASPSALEGSTAEIAMWLDAPVLLVVNAHGAARSLAATVRGFAQFEAGVRVAGVIANQGGSPRHRDWIAEALAAAGAPPLVGLVPRGSLPTLPSRHLGLVAAEQTESAEGALEELADACEGNLDVERLMEVAGFAGAKPQAGVGRSKPEPDSGSPHPLPLSRLRERGENTRVRLGIARDAAFSFYYADNLESLQQRGVELVSFSPLADRGLPDALDAIYLGGGYPELHAARLAENRSMLSDVRHFADSGKWIYAECGGLMYLGQTLTACDGGRYPLAGVLPIETTMLEKLKTLGYTEVAWQSDCLWGAAGQRARGHEFHYSQISGDGSQAGGWQPAYTVSRRRTKSAHEGFRRGRVLAGYVHLHWASRPVAVEHFLSHCEQS